MGIVGSSQEQCRKMEAVEIFKFSPDIGLSRSCFILSWHSIGNVFASDRLPENDQSKGATMPVISNASEPPDRVHNPADPEDSLQPEIIDFFSARYRIIANNNSINNSSGYGREENALVPGREFPRPPCDPVEDWLQSLISGAALVALLTAILCLPDAPTTKTESSKPRATSHTRSFLSAQSEIK